ncbi:glycosyltransferase family 2 protein [Pseudomaricurvus alkylphenolicus]|uniref:TIGR04283 family arsenosugar biosynthesis glycosyltransferase n=1 Tax=Pseudomaricurvus alkylphenolicus TaxID=1306991 RepID=UPI001423720C|nr:TIGR04283 family arsenosugar biosynthesis glycosyltransferase [Pseudomaricurvus alkylphenolicus]NIB43267.1 glycosyltransferase family 2 protein [Pseudomaricurvus alkylphenolicus]
MTLLSIVIPAYNEETVIEVTLRSLQAFRRGGGEVILSDGGSTDRTKELATPWVDKIVTGARGRAAQMNLGARHATGKWLLFLHADTRLPDDFCEQMQSLIDTSSPSRQWGFFTVHLSGRLWMLRVVAWFMNRRSRLTSVATGDQAIFVCRALWKALGGYAEMPLMEDVEFSKRARRYTRPWVVKAPLETSGRRWEQRGALRTILLMWWLRLQYFLGVSPESLARQYR